MTKLKSGMLIHPEELSRKWIDRMADAGVETLGMHPAGGRKAAETLQQMTELLSTAQYRELIDYAHARGLKIEYEAHAAGYLMPRELFSEHPEYFRVNADGERSCDHNFCVSNPEALALVARRAAELAQKLYGSTHNYYFWMDDGCGLHCHCPKCRALSPSEQQMTVLRAMLRAIRETVPDARMAYLAFMDTLEPPQSEAEDGIFLEYAPFKKYTRKGNLEEIRREQEMLRPLTRYFCREETKVLEYWYDNSLFSGWKKPPVKFTLNREEMEKDIAQYRAMGFASVSTFACFLGEDYEALYGETDIRPFADAVR